MYNGISWKDAPACGKNDNDDENGGVYEDDDGDESGGVQIFVFTILYAFNSHSKIKNSKIPALLSTWSVLTIIFL